MSGGNTFLDQYKHLYQPKYQFVLLNDDGIVVDSCNTIVDFTPYLTQSIFSEIMFLESMADTLQQLTPEDGPLIFPRLEFPLITKEGVFNYTFRRFNPDDDHSFIAWTIEEDTGSSQYLFEVQQERNNSMITGELLTLKNIEITKLNNQIQKQKKLLEDTNQKVLDSIQYASRIQKALSPPKEIIQQKLPSFILYHPKDIVSGDFYWFTSIQSNHHHLDVIAVVDCTGHGVPGAFMSVLGNTLLNQIVNVEGILEPHEILHQLNNYVFNVLNANNPAGERISDGMDMALCTLDRETLVLHYSGAKRPLILIRDNELIQYKGDASSIGGSIHSDKTFTSNNIQLQAGDAFYIFTDGFPDQFGGVEDKKFMIVQFRELLLANHSNSLEKQCEMLEDIFLEWKGENPQTDDILVIGVKL